MFKRLIQEEADRTCRESQKRNQKIHMRLEEERKGSYEDSARSQRFPHEFNRGYSYK